MSTCSKGLQVSSSTRRSLSGGDCSKGLQLCTTSELLVVELSLGSQHARWRQIRVLPPSLRPSGRKLRRNGVWSVGNIVEG